MSLNRRQAVVQSLAAAVAVADRVCRKLRALRSPVRLGREVFLTGALTNQAIAMAADTLSQFRQELDRHRVDQYRAVASTNSGSR